MVSRTLVKTVSFPARSKPHMLRVSPDGKEVWVQTADANTNVVLGADDLSVLSTEPTGKSPVANVVGRGRQSERLPEDANQMVLRHPDPASDLVHGERVAVVTCHQVDGG